jgi:hypothetical protein
VSEGLRERDQVEVDGHGLILLGLLGTAQRSRTWLAADAGDGLHVARRVSGRAEEERASLLSGLARLGQLSHPALLLVDAAWADESTVWVIRPHDPGVSLRRLAAVARLGPRIIAAIGGDVLDGLAALHAAGTTHGALHAGNILVGLDGQARIADMGLRASAAEGLGSGGAGAAPAGDRRASDIEATAAALRIATAQLRHGAPGPGRHRYPEGLAALDAVLGGPEPAFKGARSARAAREALYRAAGAPDARVRREIVALVTPLRATRPVVTPALALPPRSAPDRARPPRMVRPARTVMPEPAAVVAPEAQAVVAPEAQAVRRAEPARWARERAARAVAGYGAGWRRIRAGLGRLGGGVLRGLRWLRERAASVIADRWARRGSRRTWPVPPTPRWRHPSRRVIAAWVAAVAVIALVAAAAVLLGGRHGGGVATTLPPSASPGPSPTLAPSPPPSALPSPAASPLAGATPPAPATAGAVVGLSVTPEGPDGCPVTAGSSCEVQVNVDLAPQPAPMTVSFSLVLVDSCTGTSSTVPGGSVIAGPDYAFVWADTAVPFPSGDPETLFAVTSSPAQAASPGLSLAGSAC